MSWSPLNVERKSVKMNAKYIDFSTVISPRQRSSLFFLVRFNSAVDVWNHEGNQTTAFVIWYSPEGKPPVTTSMWWVTRLFFMLHFLGISQLACKTYFWQFEAVGLLHLPWQVTRHAISICRSRQQAVYRCRDVSVRSVRAYSLFTYGHKSRHFITCLLSMWFLVGLTTSNYL